MIFVSPGKIEIWTTHQGGPRLHLPNRAIFWVGRLRERQYQLAAQRHNEAFLKHNYYQQTARYFERECVIARQYDSWNVKDSNSKEHLEKSRKTERLLVRRNKLRNLLRSEEEVYRKELEELKELKARKRREKEQEPSLETLKERLKEKRAEQSLYLPKTCRRYRSYYLCPRETSGAHWSTFEEPDTRRVCRDTTNFPRQNGKRNSMDGGSSSKTEEKRETEIPEPSRCSSTEGNEFRSPNLKYSARYSRRSLENTNVRCDDSFESQEDTTQLDKAASLDSPREKRSPEEIHVDEQDKENRAMEMRRSKEDLLVHSVPDKTVAEPPSDFDQRGESSSSESKNQEMDDQDETDRSVKIEREKQDLKDHREFEREKSLPWMRIDPTDKNLSEQMFLYLTHKELKHKIEDLTKREMHACTKQSWDEALRLRDMRNRLELIREKRLYGMENLELDEEARKIGLESIDRRAKELAEREEACSDSTMYSEEAKALWKKWVREDDESVMRDARCQREVLMDKLEQEWQNLAIRDKERISRSFQNILSGSSLQDEHKLAARMTPKMRSFSGPAK